MTPPTASSKCRFEGKDEWYGRVCETHGKCMEIVDYSGVCFAGVIARKDERIGELERVLEPFSKLDSRMTGYTEETFFALVTEARKALTWTPRGEDTH